MVTLGPMTGRPTSDRALTPCSGPAMAFRKLREAAHGKLCGNDQPYLVRMNILIGARVQTPVDEVRQIVGAGYDRDVFLAVRWKRRSELVTMADWGDDAHAK